MRKLACPPGCPSLSFTEHLHGHHARVGTANDPATARFGERSDHFFLRSVPAQFRSAWRLEARRLGDETMRWWDARLLRSRVVHGLLVLLGRTRGRKIDTSPPEAYQSSIAR